MPIKNQQLRKIGIWSLLLAFVVLSILASAVSPPAVAAETFTLLVCLEIVSIVRLASPKSSCTVYRFEISSRSPPTC